MRFSFGDAVEHNGRPAKIAAANPTTGRYCIVYTDEQNGVALDLLGRVLSAVKV